MQMPNRWLGVAELEFNPFSLVSRGARAERDGDLVTAFRRYAAAGQYDFIHECLDRTQPNTPPARAELHRAANAFGAFRAFVDRVSSQRLPADLADAIGSAEQAELTTWHIADRLARFRPEIESADRARDRAASLVSDVEAIASETIAAKDELAALALKGTDLGDVTKAVAKLRSLSATARRIDQRLDEVLA